MMRRSSTHSTGCRARAAVLRAGSESPYDVVALWWGIIDDILKHYHQTKIANKDPPSVAECDDLNLSDSIYQSRFYSDSHRG